MNKAFISLFGFLVITIVVIGWSLDKVWQHYAPNDPLDIAEQTIADLIYDTLQNQPTPSLDVKAKALSRQYDLTIDLLALDDIAESPFLNKLKSESTTSLITESGSKQIFQLFDNHKKIMRVTFVGTPHRADILYDTFIFIFYTCIALAVFLWVWPLSKGLKQLEKNTKLVGKDTLPNPIDTYPGSPIYSVAHAFNTMATRIRTLMSTQKEMTYAVSHELRTPLARMKFALEIAEDAKDIEQVKKQLSGIKKDVVDMESLIASLLTYASFDGTQGALEQQSGDFGYLISKNIELIQQTLAEQNQQQLEILFNNDIPDRQVNCEWHLMECVVMNLLQNACRFAHSLIQVSLNVDDKGRCALSIEDDGPGIPKDERCRVFESFVRLSNSENGQQRGFGLGLALVKRIMDWHGGEIELTDSELGGARFVVVWPYHIDLILCKQQKF